MEGNNILVVGHNAINQALVCTAVGLGPSNFRRLVQSNCGTSVLDFARKPHGLNVRAPWSCFTPIGPPYVPLLCGM